MFENDHPVQNTSRVKSGQGIQAILICYVIGESSSPKMYRCYATLKFLVQILTI